MARLTAGGKDADIGPDRETLAILAALRRAGPVHPPSEGGPEMRALRVRAFHVMVIAPLRRAGAWCVHRVPSLGRSRRLAYRRETTRAACPRTE